MKNRFKEKYGSELVGEELGNFHIDFSMGHVNNEIRAIGSLFLGKKAYIDTLSTDQDGKAINSEHIRMKWIPTPSVKYDAEQHNITVLDVYTKLFNNKAIKCDLTNGGNTFVCRSNKDYAILNVSGFARECQYIRDGSDKFFVG